MVTTFNVRLLKANLKQGKTFYKLILVMKILKKIWEMQGVVKVTLYMVEFMIIMFEFMIIMLCTTGYDKNRNETCCYSWKF